MRNSQELPQLSISAFNLLLIFFFFFFYFVAKMLSKLIEFGYIYMLGMHINECFII